ncbi:trna ligase [Coemansia sp. RSA 2618]|nr:trna ligase [Coemansia sp. RSA 2618]
MTVKEDGCLILAGGLDGGKTLLITSKHMVNLNESAKIYMFKIKFDVPYLMFYEWHRTNHVLAQRKSLTTAIQAELVNCRIVALYWAHDEASAQDILEKNIDRVVARGEAHQVLTPKRTPEFRRVMNGYITTFAPLDLESESDKLIDDVIELDPLADSAANLRTVVNALCKMFPYEVKRPSENEASQALECALAFKSVLPELDNIIKEKTTIPFKLIPGSLSMG